MKHLKEPNTAGWERDVARSCANKLDGLGYHFLLTLPHNHPNDKFSKIKGKAPGVIGQGGTWVPKKDWQDASVKPNAVEAFADIGRKTKYVPNIGILCGGNVEIDGKHVGYLTALDVDTADEHAIATFSELFGYGSPIRRGRRGGTFLCITDESGSKDFTRRHGSEGFIDDGVDENKIQFLRDGKQTVVFGVHPSTLKLFQWETVPMDGAPCKAEILPVVELPVISTAQLEEVLAKLGFERGKGSKETSPEERTALSKRSKEIKADLEKTAARDFEEVDVELGITALLETDAPLRAKLTAEHEDIKDHSGNDMGICELLRLQLGASFDHHAARAVLYHFPACSEKEKQTAHHVANIMAKVERVNPYSEGKAFTVVEIDEVAEYLEVIEGLEVREHPVGFKDWCERPVEWPKGSGVLAKQPQLVRILDAFEAKAEAAELAVRERVLIAEIEISKSSEPASPEVDQSEAEKPVAKKRNKGPLIARGGDLWRDFTAPEWSVAGMFPEVGTAMLYGDSNVGKTFVALHLLDRVSRGAPFFGRRTRAADTLYVSSEGGGGLSLRLKALYDAEPFTKVSDTIMVRSDLPEFDKSPENAAKKIKLMALEARKESGRAVGVIVLDNWSLMLGDREENDNGFAAALFKALSAVADELGCLILVLHHTGKDQKNYRGPSALRASVDAMYGVKMTKELTRECEIECSKLRDGPKPPKMTYKLRTVDVTVNEHGEKVTSCIVVEGHDVSTAMGAVDDTADDTTLTPTDTPKDKMRGVLNALTTCINRSAATVGDDPSEVGVSASLVFAQLNTDRTAAGLDELKDRTAVPKFLAKLEADGKIVKSGSNRQTEYRLSD